MNDSTNTNNNTEVASNPATQTLFRFVSLRNPELAKREGNTKFIFRPEDYTGVFDDLLSGWNSSSGQSKIDFLTEKIKSNVPGIDNIRKTEKEIKDHFDWFYEFSKDLIADGSLDSTKVAAINAGVPDPFLVWDSLIYQVLVQKDFYVKELLTQMLQTLHYAKNYATFSTEPVVKKKLIQQKEVATAKVVLPESLFIDSVAVDSSATVFTVGSSAVGSQDYINGGSSNNNLTSSYLPTESVLKRQSVTVALYEKKQLDDLKKELTKAQTLYNKQYTKAYDLASKDYQALIKPLYDSYEQSLLEVEATFTEEMTEAAKKLALSQVAKPEIPDFEFEFRAERDVAFLQSKLSEASLESFVSLIGEYANPDTITGRLNNGDVLQENIVEIGEEQYILPADENQNFVELLETLDEKLSALNDEILQNTEVEKQEYVSVGGILVPVNKNVEKSLSPLAYNICCLRYPYTNGGIRTYVGFELSIGAPSNNWDISEIKFNNNGSLVDDSTYEKVISGNTITLSKLFGFTPGLRGGFSFPRILEIHILFTNGKKAIFTTGELYENTCEAGSFSISGTEDPGTEDPETPSNPNAPINTTDSFIPKDFGIKRLGIADYLKVEQSTHAYVEGEVANIENIMAREYREKSTRRLRRSEITETTSSDTEREQLTDTTTASRFEMQSEVAKIVQETTSLEAHTSFSYGPDKMRFEIGGSYANNRSKEDSMRQAVTQAQDVTSRALDRVVTKVHQERIEKIVEEFEENNSHGFDNRKGDKHVVGVYRWVDKLMKNQVWDYGKRLMFEFAVPQPAKLHLLAMSSRDKIAIPVDPRKAKKFTMKDYTALMDETILKYWTSLYNIEIDKKSDKLVLSKSIADAQVGKDEVISKNETVSIPEGYIAIDANVNGYAKYDTDSTQTHSFAVTVGNQHQVFASQRSDCYINNVQYSLNNVENNITIAIHSVNYHAISVGVNLNCELSADARKQWQLKTFNAIIEAYENAMAEYNNKIAEEETKANNIKGSNPLFYRQIEQEVLKHNCIAYLTDDKSKTKNIGTKMYTGDQLLDFKVDRTDIDEYTSFAKFMEQAFEWDIMSYNLYPYYWGNKTEWGSMYVSEDADPLFRSFLRSGMARVVVTVRPGFEDAVQFYMATGRLWNGGEVPVIGDPMYLSIVDELKDIKGETQGKPWITRIPTSLTILQAQNIGLEVQHALPFTTEDPLDFENPEEVITESNFYPSDDQMEAEKSKQVENIEINNDYLQLTNNDNPHQVIAQLSLDDLKTALE